MAVSNPQVGLAANRRVMVSDGRVAGFSSFVRRFENLDLLGWKDSKNRVSSRQCSIRADDRNNPNYVYTPEPKVQRHIEPSDVDDLSALGNCKRGGHGAVKL